PYWPPDLGGQMYRPLPLATFAVDWTLTHGHPVWFHAMNLLWHAGVAVVVTALAFGSPSPEGRGGQGVRTALAAGLLFAVHPVHVEAVANVIGLGELMAAAGVCLAVYAAVVRQNVWWSGAALVLGLLSKENALVAPALIVAAWIIQPDRKSTRLNSSHVSISYAVFCLKKKKQFVQNAVKERAGMCR